MLGLTGVLAMLLSLTATNSNANPDYCAYNPIDASKTIDAPYRSQNHFGGTTYDSIAFDFHVFANEVELNSHTNGNIATNILHANGHGFGADEKNHLDKREDNYIGTAAYDISNIASSGYTVLGAAVNTNVEQQNKRIRIGHSQNALDQTTSSKVYVETTSSSKYIDIQKELNYLAEISKTLSYKNSSEDVVVTDVSSDIKNIQVTNAGGNHYLNLSASDLSSTGKKTINISLPQKTTLIINVDMHNTNIDSLKNLVVNLNNYTNGEAIANTYCGLLWNLYDSGNPNRTYTSCTYTNVGMSDYFFGTILAPAANISYGAVNGSIIANKTKQAGQESHRFDFTGYEDPNDEPTTEGPSSETTTETPSSETTTETPSSETTTETPSSEITTETPSSRITTETPSSEITTEIRRTDISTPVSTEIRTTKSPQPTTQVQNVPTQTQHFAKTGDAVNIFLISIVLLGASGLGICLYIYKKTSKK